MRAPLSKTKLGNEGIPPRDSDLRPQLIAGTRHNPGTNDQDNQLLFSIKSPGIIGLNAGTITLGFATIPNVPATGKLILNASGNSGVQTMIPYTAVTGAGSVGDPFVFTVPTNPAIVANDWFSMEKDIFTATGAGVLRTLSCAGGAIYPQNYIMRIYYDGEATPRLTARLIDMSLQPGRWWPGAASAGGGIQGWQLTNLKTKRVSWFTRNGTTTTQVQFTLRWDIPFTNGIRITLDAAGGDAAFWYVWGKYNSGPHPYPLGRWRYFRSTSSLLNCVGWDGVAQIPIKNVLQVITGLGRGAMVGSSWKTGPLDTDGTYVENDPAYVVDGVETMRFTGTEDLPENPWGFAHGVWYTDDVGTLMVSGSDFIFYRLEDAMPVRFDTSFEMRWWGEDVKRGFAWLGLYYYTEN